MSVCEVYLVNILAIGDSLVTLAALFTDSSIVSVLFYFILFYTIIVLTAKSQNRNDKLNV